MAEEPVQDATASAGKAADAKTAAPEAEKVPEIGGPEGPDPTRYGDWEKKGRCVDF